MGAHNHVFCIDWSDLVFDTLAGTLTSLYGDSNRVTWPCMSVYLQSAP
jgi:hypothetical protein